MASVQLLAAPRLLSITMFGVTLAALGAGNGIGINSGTEVTGVASADCIVNCS